MAAFSRIQGGEGFGGVSTEAVPSPGARDRGAGGRMLCCTPTWTKESGGGARSGSGALCASSCRSGCGTCARDSSAQGLLCLA